ncbi:MAG: NUDIX hydrolase [Bacteroidales bacterium]|nr:NUDIX hydrolase [Bacteroidales bacterium]
MSYSYQYPHPAVATDCVVFGFDGKDLNILLIERGLDPYKGMWAFPGGFMKIDETAETCARRELSEETGLDIQVMKQLGAFSSVQRDPRERVVSIAFYVLVQPSEVSGGDDARQARWFPIDDVPQLAFDHDFILRKAMSQLRKDIYFEPIGFELLNNAFTMSELQRLYEAILGVHFDRRNFERKMLQTGILQTATESVDDLPASHSWEQVKANRFFGSHREMRRKDINDLFGSSDSSSQTVQDTSPHIHFQALSDEQLSLTDDCQLEAEEASPEVLPKRKPGRKGRLFSFDKEKYARFKHDNNFRFEF